MSKYEILYIALCSFVILFIEKQASVLLAYIIGWILSGIYFALFNNKK